jgi:sugar lactone lactonase YvrE
MLRFTIFLSLFFAGACAVTDFPDLSTLPRHSFSEMDRVVTLEYPSGNISAATNGRIFFSYFPEGQSPVKVAELIGNTITAFPDTAFQSKFVSVLSVRVDALNRLWVLDYANPALLGTLTTTPKLYAFDITTRALVHEFAFPKDIAVKDSVLNDMQVDVTRNRIYITDTNPLGRKGALIVYDIAQKKARRVLEGTNSVTGGDYQIRVNGEPFKVLGYPVVFNADSIALDQAGEWLYYGPFNSMDLYRIRAATLADFTTSNANLAAVVERFATKSITDGISIDTAGNIYATDPEHSAIHLIDPNTRYLQTFYRDIQLRWPDGMSFAPDGYTYLTTSSLNEVILQTPAVVKSKGPYYLYRFRPEAPGIIGR